MADTTAELVRGAFAYADRPAQVKDSEPAPSLQVRGETSQGGLRLRLAELTGDIETGVSHLTVGRGPIDSSLARIHPRRSPAPASCLLLKSEDAQRTWSSEVPAADLTIHPVGRAPADRFEIARLLDLSREHRGVLLELGPSPNELFFSCLVVQLAAAGIVVACPPEQLSRLTLLSPELRSVVEQADPSKLFVDDLQLFRAAALARRAVWAGHDLRFGWGHTQGGWQPRLRTRRESVVSVLLASRRPSYVPAALHMLAAQQGVELEVQVALHGGGSKSDVNDQLEELGLHGEAFEVPAEVPLGSVLNEAARRTSAPWIAKWDDDDLYGPQHLLDLDIARRQTGAALVGKAAEFVYLQELDEVLWRNHRGAESDDFRMAGGALMFSRDAFDDVGGFPDVPRAVDHHLKVSVRRRGHNTFRTHAFGFVLRRHSGEHTWAVDREQMRRRARKSMSGLPSVLELGDAARFSDLGA